VNKLLGVCLKFKVIVICIIILMMAAAMSTMSFTLAQTSTDQTKTSPSTTPQMVSVNGYGWINPLGKRDDFSFYARGGILRADGWRYNPFAQASFKGRDLKNNQLIHVWSTKVWRFRIDSVDAGKKTIIVGTATIKIGQQEVKGNWWFRITAKDAPEGSKDTFMIQLWRPIGANNAGGWSAGVFKADKPGSLQLSAVAFYEIQGILKGGNIVIKP
jgi:hypothetical protein